MMCYLHYYSANKRLSEWEKTVKMLGGERNAGNQVLAQRDMVRLEKNYYADLCVTWNFILFFIMVLAISFFAVYNVINRGVA